MSSSRMSLVLVLLVTSLLLILGVVSFHEGTASTRPVVPPFDLFWCEKDDDCVVSRRIGCCPCEQGGGQAAITSWHEDDLRRFLKSACDPEQVCVQVETCQPDAVARCIDRKCTLRPGQS